MAFNLAKYNINPFNVAGDRARWFNAIGAESVLALIGSALEVYPDAIGNEKVSCEISGLPTHYVSGSEGDETVLASISAGQLSIMLSAAMAETITASSAVVARITPYPIGTETVEADILLGADANLFVTASEVIDADTELGGIASLTAEGYELISESASLEIVDFKTCVLTVALDPGQKLIIDADSYTVLLDGENAIEIQSGEWIDELDRTTTEITVRASAGQDNLSTSIIYTERYL